jgi:glycosyltransferase involved in cell wall biosynthesis
MWSMPRFGWPAAPDYGSPVLDDAKQAVMRILFLSNIYPPHYLGGYELRCQDVVNGLMARGHAVQVITSTYGVERRVVEGHVERVWHCMWNTRHRPKTRAQRLYAEVVDNLHLRRTIDRFQPDVISVWNMLEVSHSLAVTAQRSGLPVVFHVEHDWMLRDDPWLSLWSDSSRLPSFIKRAGVRKLVSLLVPTSWSVGSTARCVFVSEYRKEQHRQAGLPVADSPVIRGGIPHTRFLNRRFEALPPPRPRRLLFVGVLIPGKGPHVAIEAISHLRTSGYADATLTIVGQPVLPEYYQRLRQAVAQHGLGDHVRFLGARKHEEMPAVYGEHDVLLFTSTSPEGFPLTISEAMASGLAVVSSVVGGQAEVLKDGENALTYPAGDAARLAECVKSLIDRPDFARRLALAGRELVSGELTLEIMLDRYERFLRRVAGAGVSP